MPLVGWVSLKGVCPYCGESLSVDGPMCEMLCSGIVTSVVLRYGLTLQTLEVVAIVCALMVISLTSLQDYRIPNGCILFAVLIRIVFLLAQHLRGEAVGQLAISSVVGAAALGIPLAIAVFLSNAMLDRDITGMGTVKLVAVMGLFLGWQQGLLAMAGACLLLIAVWVLSPTKLLPVEVEGGAHRNPGTADRASVSPRDLRASLEEDIAEPMRVIPFAPAICVAFWVMLLLGITPAVWNAPIL